MTQISSNNQISIIIPTYNESQNILKVIESILKIQLQKLSIQTIVVDDNSPDGTGKILEDYLHTMKQVAGHTIEILHRKAKSGLSSAVLYGIEYAKGHTIVVMDSDLSHPPHLIPKMIEAMNKSKCDIVVASRYLKEGKIIGWPLKRKIISKTATKIAKAGLRVSIEDPMSGFFAFKRYILEGLKLDAIGYKMLLEILVKKTNVTVKEIPYTFTERQFGESKMGLYTILNYCTAVWKLYRYGRKVRTQEKRKSIHFFSKAARFFTVGASGLGVNYLISFLFATSMVDLWYLHANIVGIVFSMTTNFLLNKTWTFGDRNFSTKRTLLQYGKFIGFSSIGALVQLGMVYHLVENSNWIYPTALIIAVLTAGFGNFILNKKWTFGEKIWN